MNCKQAIQTLKHAACPPVALAKKECINKNPEIHKKLSIKNLSSQQFIHHRHIDLEHLNPKPGLLNSPVLPISQDWSIPTSLSSAWVSQNFLVTEPNFGPGMISDLHNDGTYQAVWPKHHGDNHLNNINISWYILNFYKFLTYYITFIKKWLHTHTNLGILIKFKSLKWFQRCYSWEKSPNISYRLAGVAANLAN